jgi:hypothetical protein
MLNLIEMLVLRRRYLWLCVNPTFKLPDARTGRGLFHTKAREERWPSHLMSSLGKSVMEPADIMPSDCPPHAQREWHPNPLFLGT